MTLGVMTLGPGRSGSYPQSSHRSRRADHPHLARHLMSSLPARFGGSTLTRSRSQGTRCVSRRRFMTRHPLPSPGSLRLVPLGQQYYGILRLPAAPLAALRFLRLAIPSLRPFSSPSAPDAEPGINLESVGGLSSRLARWKRQGLPSSQGIPRDHWPCSSTPA